MASLKLMHRGPYETPDELEETLIRSYVNLQPQLTPPYHLSTLTAAQPVLLTQALLCGVLLNPSAAPSHVTHLTAVTTDGYASYVAILLRLVNESYPKLLEQTRTQIVWMFKQLIPLSAADVDNLCLSLLRQVAGGDLSPGNVWLATKLLEIIKSSWAWFSASPVMLTTALYTYLRLLPDHAMGKTQPLIELKQNEIAFCVQILRDRFQDCLGIGRDLVRLLQDVTFIPDFEAIWRDLLNNPTSFKAAAFGDIAQLYLIRTPTRYLVSRITPEMENQMRFMLTHVKMGNQRRYQSWFAQRFLSSPESETLVCDLIRFVCCVHHPTNQVLQSDVVPRWAIVGWLLKCCKSNHVEANAKLALFYDWLFFGSRTDNIMNIEPGILLMVHSIPKYVDMTHSLLEFLFLLLEHYDPVRKDLIQKGVTSSFDILVGKGVVHSLDPLSADPKVALWLREKLIFYFGAYCKNDQADGFKQMKPELMHQEASSDDHGHQQMSGPMVKGGQVHTYGREQGPGGNVPAVAGQNYNSDVVMDDLKSGEGESSIRKRRRLGVTESLLSDIQSNFEKLTEALTGSLQAGLGVLENLVMSFLSASDQLSVDKINKDSPLTRGGDGLPSSTDSTPITVSKFASQVTDVLKRSGYELFGPLHKVPSDLPEGDERSSLTSTLLRFYVSNCRRYPQLLQLLICWHKEGFAVGARLLCYVSRLAEEIEPMSCRNPQPKDLTGSATPESETVTNFLTREEDSYDPGINGDGDDTGEVGESSGGSARENRKNGLTGVASLKVHGTPNSAPLNRRASQSRDLDSTGDMGTRLRVTVVDAFRAYVEFLKLSNKGAFNAQIDSSGSSQNQGPQNTVSQILAKPDAAELDGDNSDVDLFSDLETCFLWNTNRFLRVLPSVFRYLPKLSTGRDDIVQLLISSLDPLELSNFEFRLLLGEFVIIGDYQDVLSRSIKNSLKWEFIEQQIFWRLLVAELQGASSAVILDVLKICSTVLSPQVNSEAQSGLLLLLRYQVPTSQLVNAVLSLPPAFGRFAAVVLASWESSHHSQLLACLQTLNSGSPKERQKKGGEDVEDTMNNGVRRFSSTAVIVLLNSLNDIEFIGSNGEEKNIRMTRAGEIKRALLKLTGIYSFVGVSSLQGSNETAIENHQERKLPS